MDEESAVQVTSIALQTANLTAAAYRSLARAGLLTTSERDYAVAAIQAIAKRIETSGHDDLAAQLWTVARQIEAYPGLG